MPKGIEKIEMSAFECCQYLEEINLNEGLIEIGSRAFVKCNFETILLPDSLNIIGVAAFAENTNFKKVIIPKNIEALDCIFYGCNNLESITFLNDEIDANWSLSSGPLTNMHYGHAFDGCDSELINIYFPDKQAALYDELSILWNSIKFVMLPLSPKPDGIIGDADYNDKIGIPDAVTLMTFLAGKEVTISANADINQDGKINVFDMILIKRMLMK